MIRPSILITALLCTSCMKPNPLALELAEGTDTGTTGEPDDEPSEADDEGDTETGPDGDGDGDGDDPPLSDLPDDEPMCGSLEPLEPDCAACVPGTCCETALACAEIEGCLCLAACDLAGGAGGACKNQCGAKPDEIPELELLLTCVAADCSDAC